jgi:aspartate aminotransferase-like enzyme
VSKLLQLLENEHGVVLAGGQGSLSGKIFRIGHLGWVTEKDIKEVTDAIAKVIPQASL